MRSIAPSASRLFSIVLSLTATSVGITESLAGEPVLQFDYSRTVACRDVTPPELAEMYPDERIVECTLRLSVQLVSGSMSDVSELRVEFTDGDSRLRVHDFSPRTRLESEFADAIETTKTVESNHSFTASLGGELPCLGGAVANVTPSIGGGKENKNIVTEKVKRVPPMQAVVASGTMNEEHGVFFILRPSPTGTLEGVHEFSVQFVVPATWRGDAARVTCQAAGTQKVLWMKQQAVWGHKSTPVALFLAGDLGARRAAMKFVERH